MFCFFGLVTEAPTFEAKSSEEVDIPVGTLVSSASSQPHPGITDLSYSAVQSFLEVASARLDPVTLALAMS
jgi:hypothetical protein